MIEGNGLLVSEGLRADGVLVDAPAPLGTIWIPLSSGLTVLYGRNGAGKTRVLEAVACALRGIALPEGHVSLHLTPVDDVGYFDHSLLSAFLTVDNEPEDIDLDLGSSSPQPHSLPNVDADDEAYDKAVLEAVERLRAVLRSAAEPAGLAEGLCHSPRLALVAVGDEQHPMWKAHVSVVPTDVQEFARRHQGDAMPWEVLRPRIDPGIARLPLSMVHLRTPSGWSDVPLPVLVADAPFKTDQQPGDQRDDGLAAEGVIACLYASAQLDVEKRTLDAAQRAASHAGEDSMIAWADGESADASPSVADLLDTLSQNATLALQALTGGQAAVRAVLQHPNEWLAGKVVSWLGTDAYDTEVGIAELGAGAARWARLAISLALSNADMSHASIVMVDEPERALHSSAQQQAANAVLELIRDAELGAVPVVGGIVATHSAAFLSLPGTNLVHVARGSDNKVTLDSIDPTLGVEGLTALLGISRTDALLTTRWFIFVEGEHDAAIIRTLFSKELTQHHAQLRTMDGASNVAAHINTDLLIAYSDAKIRVVLDRVGAAAAELWNEAVEAAKSSDSAKARRSLEKLARQQGRESKWLYEAGLAALARGHLDRIELVGLERPDIINYLPPVSFVPGATSWTQLFNEYRRSKRPEPFKQWLRAAKGARFDASTLAEIAATLTDLGDLPRVVQGL